MWGGVGAGGEKPPATRFGVLSKSETGICRQGFSMSSLRMWSGGAGRLFPGTSDEGFHFVSHIFPKNYIISSVSLKRLVRQKLRLLAAASASGHALDA